MQPETPSDPELRFAPHQGGEVAYAVEGHGDRSIVAVPGLPGSVRDFRWLAPLLADRYRVVRLELPGYGASSRRGYKGMSVSQRADAVRSVMGELELQGACLMGHSAGSMLITEIAARSPELVSSCIYVAPNGPRPHYPLRVYRALSQMLRVAPGRAGWRWPLKKIYTSLGFPKRLSDRERFYTTLDSGAADYDLYRECIGKLRQPCLVAWAGDDRLIPDALSQSLSDSLPAGERVRFDTGGHNIQKTMAVELADAIGRFLG